MRIPATEDTVKQLNDLATKAVELIAGLQLLDTEAQVILEQGAKELGIVELANGYDFVTNEYVIEDISDMGGVERLSDETPISQKE